MKKRFSILTLTLLFLVSTTGLPVFYHYCEMIGKKSFSECKMCKMETEEKEHTSCCSQPIQESRVQIVDKNSECCVDEFDYKKIEDNFAQSSNTVLINCSLVLTDGSPSLVKPDFENKYSQASNYNLPPPKFGKELLNSIHQLKLDLPVC